MLPAKREIGVIKRMLTALAAIGFCGTALAAEVIDSRFEVDYTHNGTSVSQIGSIVPNLPESACYYWYLQFDPSSTSELTLIETLQLPVPLEAWKDYRNDPASEMQISADARSAVVTLKLTPDSDGWTSHGWCVAAGDPLGEHHIGVSLDGAMVGDWTFRVVAPEEFDFGPGGSAEPQSGQPDPAALPPAFQPSPTARDVNQSW